MPRQVFAEEIERFLGGLNGVGAARILTTPAGDVSQVYVTADSLAETRAVRRTVVAALATAYGVHVEPWRIQVTQLRAGLRPAEIPRFRLLRMEETVSESETAAEVHLAWMHGGQDRTVIGRARGPSNSIARARTLAAATIDAARAAVDVPHRRITVGQVSLQTFLDRPMALVGISVSTPRGPELMIGVALHDDREPDAVILATLDAVTKWLLKAGTASEPAQEAGRRAQLEGMRRFMRAAERGGVVSVPKSVPEGAERPQAALPSAGTEHTDLEPAGSEPAGPEAAAPERVEPEGARPEADAFEIDETDFIEVVDEVEPFESVSPEADSADSLPEESTPPPVWGGQEAGAVVRAEALQPGPSPALPGEGIADDEDVIKDINQIRPVRKGGAAMAVHPDSARGGMVPPRAGRPSMEEAFYQGLIEGQTPVHLRCRDGYEIPHAVVKDVGTYTLLLETGGGRELIYKHAIISIRPLPAPTTEA